MFLQFPYLTLHYKQTKQKINSSSSPNRIFYLEFHKNKLAKPHGSLIGIVVVGPPSCDVIVRYAKQALFCY